MPVLQARLAQLAGEIQESVLRAEVLGEQGNVDGAQAAVLISERLNVSSC